MKAPFRWDHYSDQPYQLKDKKYKKTHRRKEWLSIILTFCTALLILPLAYLLSFFIPKRKIDTDSFFALGVDNDKEISPPLLQELGINHILVRQKLWKMKKLPKLKEFISTCKVDEITVNILQDREHIEDLDLLKKDLRKIFASLHVARFQIGSTINRAKWGFFSINEYLQFFKVAYDLKQNEFPNIKLLGSGVIDFEYHFTAHTLFNLCKCKYDGVASLLYVDRRGAPENKQMGFDFLKKIKLLSMLAALSPKTKNKIYITEANWPISNTAPYAPTSEYECISQTQYAEFMVRYYCLALASCNIDAVCWHQLIAPGYGLIDNRNGINKRGAFTAYQTMVSFLKGCEVVSFSSKSGHYVLTCKKNGQIIQVHWSLTKITIDKKEFNAFDIYSTEILQNTLQVHNKPIYLIKTRANI